MLLNARNDCEWNLMFNSTLLWNNMILCRKWLKRQKMDETE